MGVERHPIDPMKRDLVGRIGVARLALFMALCAATPGAANTLANWTNGAGNNTWETPANWDIGQVPNNSSYDVRFSTSATCNFSSMFQIGALTISTATTTLSFLPASSLAIASSNGIFNNGKIVVNSTGANSPTTLQFDTSAPVNGTGSIQLNGINPGNAMLVASSGVTLTHNANHTILGRGDVSATASNAVLVNNGTINANLYGGTLRVSLNNSVGNQNNGTLKATAGGSLVVAQGFLDQRGGGVIFGEGADNNSGIDSRLQLGDGTHPVSFLGGTFGKPTGPGVYNIIYAADMTVNGCTNWAGLYMSQPGLTILENGLVDNGSVHGSDIRFGASAAITGTGIISIDNLFANGFTITHGTQHTIFLYNDLIADTNNGRLINNGTITSFGGAARIFLSNSGNQNNGTLRNSANPPLLLARGAIDQSGGGKIVADATVDRHVQAGGYAGTVQIGGPDPFTVIGGTLETVTVNAFGDPTRAAIYGIIQGVNAVLSGNITNQAHFEIPANDRTIVNAINLANKGTLTLNANTSFLRFDGSTTVTGSGLIILTNNATLEINNNAVNRVTNGSDHTLTGSGTVQIDSGSTLTNNGTIAPGVPVGTLRVSGDLQLSFASNLSFDIGGTNPGIDYDVLQKTDPATLTLNGKLTLRMINGFTPLSSDTFKIVTTSTALAGGFTNVRNGGRLNTADGSGSFLVTYSGNNVVLSNFGPPLAASQPRNISTRVRVLTGDNVLIGGFIITGSDPKKVIVRGLGPSLASHGVPDPLADPTLELHNGTDGSVIASNDNWSDTQQTEIQNTGLAPSNEREAAIVRTLPANNSAYTVVLRGKNDSTGVGLVEIYDLNPAATSKLVNISSRGFVGTDDNVMIAGVIIGAETTTAGTLLVRGLGPQLTQFGIVNALADPTLELRDGNGSLVATNDNWKDTQQATIQGTGIPPGDDRESAIFATLASGNYTAILRGATGGTGNGLIEVYNLP